MVYSTLAPGVLGDLLSSANTGLHTPRCTPRRSSRPTPPPGQWLDQAVDILGPADAWAGNADHLVTAGRRHFGAGPLSQAWACARRSPPGPALRRTSAVARPIPVRSTKCTMATFPARTPLSAVWRPVRFLPALAQGAHCAGDRDDHCQIGAEREQLRNRQRPRQPRQKKKSPDERIVVRTEWRAGVALVTNRQPPVNPPTSGGPTS